MSHPIASHIPSVSNGSYPVRPGNLVRPLVDGVPAFRRICEAVEAARHSVWLAVAFIRPEFRLPDGRGSLFDLLDRAVARGLDVRVIFWRPNAETAYVKPDTTFPGSAADRAFLEARSSRVRIRWDRTHSVFCQHQKSWVIDAGYATETAFVGGINLNQRAMVSPGHAGGGDIHDAYVEITGPSATDVHHNFVQRWNEASDRNESDGLWAHATGDTLAFPQHSSVTRGDSPVQIQRNIHAGRYSDGTASPGAQPFAIGDGESGIRQQYLAAIAAARSTIYIENQALTDEPVADALAGAVARGVQTILLVPAEPERWVGEARRKPDYQGFFDKLAVLGRHENFTLAGLAARNASGGRTEVYIHGKLMLVDDAWATIGSCNLHRNSLYGHSEINASIWDAQVARALRCELFAEHLGHDTMHLDDRAALRLFRQVANANRALRDSGNSGWQGLAYSLDAARYGA